MDLMYFYPTLTEAALRGVCHVSLSTAYPAALAERGIEIVGRRAGWEAAAPVLGLLLSLVVGKAAHVRPHEDWARHQAVLSAAARCFASLPDPGALSPALMRRRSNCPFLLTMLCGSPCPRGARNFAGFAEIYPRLPR